MLKFLIIMMMMIISKKLNSKFTMTMIMVLFGLSMQTYQNSKMTYIFNSDLISFWISTMTILIFYAIIFIKTKSPMMNKKMIMTMAMILVMTFNSWNFLMFYMLFEITMINIMLIIIYWGYQPERTEAVIFMVMMTLLMSMPFLVSLMKNKETLSFWFMEMELNKLTFMSFILIFMVKMPTYFVHFWLPKAHVEAPVQGSIILAAILLKLGCFGIIRTNKMMVKFKLIISMLISMSMWSMILMSMAAMTQIDLKTLIAYSSIVHMSMVFNNILMMKNKSIFSSMLIIIGHGMCSASLFYMANTMYENSKSRSMIINKGILKTMPAMTLMWFISCMNNAPMPPSMNMMGELISFKSLMTWSNSLFSMIVAAAFMSSMYSIYLFCVSSHGQVSKTVKKSKMNTTKKAMTTTIMLSPLILVMAKPEMMMI